MLEKNNNVLVLRKATDMPSMMYLSFFLQQYVNKTKKLS